MEIWLNYGLFQDWPEIYNVFTETDRFFERKVPWKQAKIRSISNYGLFMRFLECCWLSLVIISYIFLHFDKFMQTGDVKINMYETDPYKTIE